MKKSQFIDGGPPEPNQSELDGFYAAAKNHHPDLPTDYHVRWIGIDDATTEEIFGLIKAKEKTGTFTLPWIWQATEQKLPEIGDTIILIDYHGHPNLLVQLTQIDEVPFGAISETHTSIDGPPVRDLKIWKPLHTDYWNALLQAHGKQVTDEMPVLVERFTLIATSNE